MPKKGKTTEAERTRQSAPPFEEMAKWRSGVEARVGNLERRGMDRVPSYGADGFKRMAMLSALALNVRRMARRRSAALGKGGSGKRRESGLDRAPPDLALSRNPNSNSPASAGGSALRG